MPAADCVLGFYRLRRSRSVEHINPYAVVRNTQAHEAYRAYRRAEMNSGLGLLFLGMLLPALWLPLEMFVARRFDHPRTADSPLLLAFIGGPAALSGLLVLVGGLQLRRFRREHPIPDAWRQIPRVGWPQKPRVR